jgi:hypothetical protein
MNFECIRFGVAEWILASQKVLYIYCLHPPHLCPISCGGRRAHHCLIQKITVCTKWACRTLTWCYHWSLWTVICCDDLSLTSSFTPCSGFIEYSLRPAIEVITGQHIPDRFISAQDYLPVLANFEPHHRAITLCQLSCSTIEVARLLAQPVHMESTAQHRNPWWTWCNA